MNATIELEITKVAARRVNGAYALITNSPVPRGGVVLPMLGEITSEPSKYSIQIGEGRHLEPYYDPLDFQSSVRFLNHSCDPSTYISFEDLTVRALRDLEAGEEVNFNYNTTEYDMANPFECHCDSVNCLGYIGGYRHLSLGERIKLDPHIAPHLRGLLAPASA
jgi:hypothetical protein